MGTAWDCMLVGCWYPLLMRFWKSWEGTWYLARRSSNVSMARGMLLPLNVTLCLVVGRFGSWDCPNSPSPESDSLSSLPRCLLSWYCSDPMPWYFRFPVEFRANLKKSNSTGISPEEESIGDFFVTDLTFQRSVALAEKRKVIQNTQWISQHPSHTWSYWTWPHLLTITERPPSGIRDWVKD